MFHGDSTTPSQNLGVVIFPTIDAYDDYDSRPIIILVAFLQVIEPFAM